MLNRPYVFIVTAAAIAAVVSSREAQAQPAVSCGTPMAGFNDVCILGYMSLYYNGAQFFTEDAQAVSGQDSGNGEGIWGSSASGVGVMGLAGTSTGPSLNYAGVAGVTGSFPTDSADYMGVYGSSANGDGGHFLTNVNGYSGLYAKNSTTGTSYRV
jgi:hypothetical protein